MRIGIVYSLIMVWILMLICVEAHSNLAYPLPTRELHCRVGSQHGRDCYGPCPRLDTYGRWNHPVSADSPAATWRRGQLVTIRWHRDNRKLHFCSYQLFISRLPSFTTHILTHAETNQRKHTNTYALYAGGRAKIDDGSGFVRLSLVPVSEMMNKGVHNKFSFYYSCMGVGLHKCEDRSVDVCGNDMEGKAWQSKVLVPTIYPDGVYVLGWSWYGGGDFRGHSFFGDYYACSFVRIQGGARVTPSFGVHFNSYAGSGRCVSAVDRAGVCRREPCRVGRTMWTVPREFQGGTSSTIEHAELIKYVDNGTREEAVEVESKTQLLVVFVDVERRERRVEVRDGWVYERKRLPQRMTVEAVVGGDVSRLKMMEFRLDGAVVGRERSAPFVMFGNTGVHVAAWANVPLRRLLNVTVVVVLFDGTIASAFRAAMQFV